MPRRQRRSRYTVTSDRGREVVLAYSREGAATYFAQRGRRVTGVEEGDYRKPKRPLNQWKQHHENIDRAIQWLGINFPVTITVQNHHGGRWGNHALRVDGSQLYHEIKVKSWLTPYQAGQTLWHELAHAMQAERAVARSSATTARERARAWYESEERTRDIHYRRRPCEVEARAHERHNVTTPLAQGA